MIPLYLSLLALPGMSTACTKSAPPPGKVVTVETVCNEADGARVRLTGYVRYRRGLLSFCSTYGGHKTCDLELYEGEAKPADFDIMRPSKEPEAPSAKLSVPVGDSPGQMNDLPDKFRDSDVIVHLAGKASASDGTRITIDGPVSVIPGDPKTPQAPKSCFVTVDWATAG
jgi:hypothetical protein